MTIYYEMKIKTKNAIQNAFIDLLLEKKFSKITIREIATIAQVNRETVYYHYEDKFDLLSKIEGQLITQLSEKILHLTPNSVLQEARGAISTFSKSVFQYIEYHQKVFNTFLSPHSDDAFARTLRQIFVDQFLSKDADHQSIAN
ncbi:TetR/AcrR family transcriptional regulator [Psychrobacillus antarcticus]|uniref:TetR/AcrR family transcriptional regulator n=1 Tax=Psychrobacillus antarcticus TaxID=2879115 RepID=UPI002407BCD6|nr:TetR/AcrR family transcriptional regulator [Psychrobacillus antarcticus]